MAKRKKTTGVTVVIADSIDPSKFEEFKAWYQNVHSPDIVATGAYFASNRYDNPKAEKGRLVAIHETDWDDVTVALQTMRKSIPEWQSKGRIYGGMKAQMMATFKRIL